MISRKTAKILGESFQGLYSYRSTTGYTTIILGDQL
jgi:hypothetical protein